MRVMARAMVISALFLASACARHVLLRPADPNVAVQQPAWVCGANATACTQGGSIDPASTNMSGTTPVPLPECQHGIGRILVQNAQDTPTVHVWCREYQQDGIVVPGPT